MVKTRAWPVKAMYILIAAALAISLIIIAAPLQKAGADCTADVCAEWDRVDTPTTDGWVLSPRSYIVDANVAAEGEVAYAIQEKWYDGHDFVLLKSDDYAATWDDITDALVDEAEEELFNDDDGSDYIDELVLVATDWEDPDFVAVALVWYEDDTSPYYFLNVFFSTDGGDTFIDTGQVEDTVFFPVSGMLGTGIVADLVVTPESGGEREIAISGMDDQSEAALFRCTVTGDNPESWEDATDYDGWDDNGGFYANSTWALDLAVSPSWGIDKTILVTTISPAASDYDVYLQCGSWGTSEGWNEDSTLGIEAVMILDDEDIPTWLPMWDARAIAGMTLPEDYNSKNTDERILWVWANYYDGTTPMCDILRVEDDSADLVGPMGQIEDGELFLTNISYRGTIAEGEAMAGVLGDGMDHFAECCEGVQVYRNDGIRNMDICCERWHDACKPPTGRAGMGVYYVGDDKAYAVTIGEFEPYDESAWSVTFDDGDTWNQLSLIDTDIEYISDVAVSPDCNKTFLATVSYRGDCSCDSVWLHAVDLHEAEEYSGQWLRTWCGHLVGWNSNKSDHSDFPFVSRRSLLRLAQDETDGMNVFLLDRMTGDVYWNDLETLACWDPIGSTELDEIVDFVAQDAETLFALDYNGDVAMFADDEWQEAVESEVDYGWTIAVWGDYILVGGQDGDVCYTDDYDPDAEDDVFTELEDVSEDSGAHVTVAFDSYFDQNDTVYAALANADPNGIYILVIGGETEDWTKLAANDDYDYTGLVLDRADGNPWTSPETGGVLYASYRGEYCDDCCGNEDISGDGHICWDTGVARCLTPIVEICCGAGEAEWDYLTWDLCWEPEVPNDGNHCADFRMPPQALAICGCLSADTNSHLFAIDGAEYDMDEGMEGTVWTFEDCYAKKGVEVTGPDDGEVIASSYCDYCDNVPFRIEWDRLCDACCYEIEFALDEDFTDLYMPWDYSGPCGDNFEVEGCCNPDWICPDVPTDPSYWVESMFMSETTYYWRMRAVEAETCQDIKSWWSEPRSFTVAPTAEAGAINLVSPEPGALDQPTKNVGFSWDLIATADAFDWVLDDNSDFSSPVESKTGLTNTAYGCTKTLEHGTTYYWQVTAYNDGAPISTSAVGTFTTGATGEFCCPQDGMCFDTQAELEAYNAEHYPSQPATPFWVWVVIGIGAVLVIVVIVLIFRTRRV